jgi:hypothetical protein
MLVRKPGFVLGVLCAQATGRGNHETWAVESAVPCQISGDCHHDDGGRRADAQNVSHIVTRYACPDPNCPTGQGS